MIYWEHTYLDQVNFPHVYTYTIYVYAKRVDYYIHVYVILVKAVLARNIFNEVLLQNVILVEEVPNI